MRFRRIFEPLLLILCAALLAFQLFVPPSLGVADNNDFPKLTGPFCIGQENHELFDYASFSFRIDPKYCWHSGFVTSAAVPLEIALTISRAVLPAGQFDLRILGAIYAVLFLVFFRFLQVSTRELGSAGSVVAPVLVLLIFDTATYVPGFSTFYFDTASFIFLLFCGVFVCRLVLRGAVAITEYLLAALVVILLVTSKTQHAPLGVLTIPAFLLAFGRVRFPSWGVRISAVAAITSAAIAMVASAPQGYSATNYYNALFYKALVYSDNAESDLAQLKLDPNYVQYIGQHAFISGSPMQTPAWSEAFGRKVTMGVMIRYYAGHPRVAMRVLNRALSEGGLQRVRMEIGSREYRLGNYEKTTGRPAESQSRFLDFWSEGKAWIFGNRGWLYALYGLVILSGAWVTCRSVASAWRVRAYWLAGILTAMVFVSATVVLLDGIDTGRHLFLFNALLDLSICALAGFLARYGTG